MVLCRFGRNDSVADAFRPMQSTQVALARFGLDASFGGTWALYHIPVSASISQLWCSIAHDTKISMLLSPYSVLRTVSPFPIHLIFFQASCSHVSLHYNVRPRQPKRRPRTGTGTGTGDKSLMPLWTHSYESATEPDPSCQMPRTGVSGARISFMPEQRSLADPCLLCCQINSWPGPLTYTLLTSTTCKFVEKSQSCI